MEFGERNFVQRLRRMEWNAKRERHAQHGRVDDNRDFFFDVRGPWWNQYGCYGHDHRERSSHGHSCGKPDRRCIRRYFHLDLGFDPCNILYGLWRLERRAGNDERPSERRPLGGDHGVLDRLHGTRRHHCAGDRHGDAPPGTHGCA